MRWSPDGPYSPQPLSGTKARGRAYEHRVGKRLAKLATALGWTLRDHEWLEHDGHWLQPDFVLQAPSGCCVLIECKLTWVECQPQILRYCAALEAGGFFCTPVLCVRNLTPECPSTIHQLEDAVPWAIWHLLL